MFVCFWLCFCFFMEKFVGGEPTSILQFISSPKFGIWYVRFSWREQAYIIVSSTSISVHHVDFYFEVNFFGSVSCVSSAIVSHWVTQPGEVSNRVRVRLKWPCKMWHLWERWDVLLSTPGHQASSRIVPEQLEHVCSS